LELKPWKLVFKKGWDKHFKKLDNSTQQRILKKIEQMKQALQACGLKASKAVVEEVSQYRIAFYQNEEKRRKEIHFVGNHKQYEKWYKEQTPL
jgi:mRNA-degrading endonuclease RelE of RelBE toxin-antitoxin system